MTLVITIVEFCVNHKFPSDKNKRKWWKAKIRQDPQVYFNASRRRNSTLCQPQSCQGQILNRHVPRIFLQGGGGGGDSTFPEKLTSKKRKVKVFVYYDNDADDKDTGCMTVALQTLVLTRLKK